MGNPGGSLGGDWEGEEGGDAERPVEERGAGSAPGTGSREKGAGTPTSGS